MTFEEAKSIKLHLESKVKQYGDKLDGFPKSASGLVPYEIRRSLDYIDIKSEYLRYFRKLQDFNRVFIVAFKKELKQERSTRFQ